MNGRQQKITRIAGALYALLMLWLLFGQRVHSGMWAEYSWDALSLRINLVPFRTIAEFVQSLNAGSRTHAVINLLGNVLMFVPLGWFIPRTFEKYASFLRCMALALAVLTGVELVQLVTMLGSLDVDDVILNLLGTAIGYAAHVWMKKK